jgi:hypothetical protein
VLVAMRIIEEMHLPPAFKTVPPIDAGGIAGGEKYAVGNIFFKLVPPRRRRPRGRATLQT